MLWIIYIQVTPCLDNPATKPLLAIITHIKEIIFSKREYQEKPDLQGLQKLWNVVKCVGNYIVCNTYAAGMQQIFQ